MVVAVAVMHCLRSDFAYNLMQQCFKPSDFSFIAIYFALLKKKAREKIRMVFF